MLRRTGEVNQCSCARLDARKEEGRREEVCPVFDEQAQHGFEEGIFIKDFKGSQIGNACARKEEVR